MGVIIVSDSQELIQQGFAAINQRLTDYHAEHLRMHAENVKRMDFIAEQTQRTNGRVTTLEAVTRSLQDEFQAVRRRWHDFRETLTDHVSKQLATYARGTAPNWDDRPLTRRELTTVIMLIVASAGIAVSITVFIMSRLPHLP